MAVTQDLPSKSELLQLISTFPFNVILGMAMILVVGTVLTFTRKPAGNPVKKGDAIRKTTEVEGEVPQQIRAGAVNHPAHEFEEEMPRHFEDYKDGVVKLYNWFNRFTQSRFGEITDSMTPREFKRAVLGRLPSDDDSALEYLVTSFEIANYSDSKLTKELLDKTFKAVELLKGVIERGSSGEDDQELNHESSPLLRNIDENSTHRRQSTTKILT
jgi:hypothetical protein